MTVEIFMILLTFFSTLTSLATEAVKKVLDGTEVKLPSNIIALLASVLVAGFGMSIFYVLNDYDWNAVNIVSIALMMLANWLGSMLGYDKIKQIITQFKK
jgi:hypothetical protein